MNSLYKRNFEGAQAPFSSRSSWLLVGSLILFMASLVVLSQVNAYRARSILNEVGVADVWVEIEGAVHKPGRYLIPVGMTVGQALKKARPKVLANVDALDLKKNIDSPLTLTVEEWSRVKVRVEGEVLEAVELELAAGERISDLRTKVSLTPMADKTFFRKKRVLKNGDVIVVPKKAVE